MGWFGKNDNSQDCPAGNTLEQPKKTEDTKKEDYFTEVILPMILAKEKEVRDKQEEVLVQYTEEHQKHIDGFDFSCVRHGDFFTVFMTNLEAAKIKRIALSPPKFSTTINLGLVSRIELMEGHGVDLNGEVRYYASNTLIGDTSLYNGYNDEVMYRPSEGRHHVIRSYQKRPFKEDSYLLPFNTEPNYRFNDGSYPPRVLGYITKDYPRPAVDDVVYFHGANVGLLTPAGKGIEVEAKILEVLAKGYEPKGILHE